jgi:acyl-CoA reductase-like NAD-dependent aldehyde dehydrogenase
VSKTREPLRLDVRKTYALFVDGEFVRSESGRSDLVGAGTDDSANVARASRDDVTRALAAARAALPRWAGATGLARGLALYRLAELLDDRRAQLVDRLRATRIEEPEATREVNAAVDRALWYAGWCDKYAASLSARAPVAAPFYTFSAPEPMGVVGAIAPDEPSLLGLVSAVLPPLVSGNAVVVLASETDPRTASVFAECVARCELPAGALNILTGRRIELAPHLARHAGLDALATFGLDEPFAAELARLGSDKLTRCRVTPQQSPAEWFAPDAQDLAHVAAFTETKTIWHPALV